MTDENQERPLVDLDAGEGFGFSLIPLRKPFKISGVVFESLRMAEPTGGDVVNALKGEKPIEEFDALAEVLCGLPPGTLKRIAAVDRKAALKRLGELLADAPSGK